VTTATALARALQLVVVTDEHISHPRAVDDVVEAALEGGCRCIQLRAKGASAQTLLDKARALRTLTRLYDALLIVNDRFDIALAAKADGVHVGPNDVPVDVIRRCVPESFVIGASCDDVDEARRLEAAGADYLGCGTVYATRTKTDAGAAIGVAKIRELVSAVSIPVVAIGGVTTGRAHELSGTGAQGIAVVGAVMSAPDPEAATRKLLRRFEPDRS
jgi:thiamine-phosphate pyrophosphorylase